MKTTKVVKDFTWSKKVVEYTWHYAKVLNDDNTTTLKRIVDSEEQYSICNVTGLPVRDHTQLPLLREYATEAIKAIGFFSSVAEKPFIISASIQIKRLNKVYWMDVIYERPIKRLIFKKRPDGWSPEEIEGKWKYLAVGDEKSTNGKMKSICDHLMCR